MNAQRRTERGARGFTLVELMVGLLIGILSCLVIAGVLIISNKQKQTTATGADAQTSGALATFVIERDLRMSGYGTNFSSLLGCDIHAYDEGVSPSRSFDFVVYPVLITAGTGGAPDSITVVYGTSDVGFNAPNLTQANAGNNANYKVSNRFGFHEGNLIVVSEPGVDSNSDGRPDCTLAQVTGVPGTKGQTDNIIHNSGNYTNAAGQNVPARYNKPGGLGISYSTSAKVYNLGDMPVNKTYSVDTSTNQLTMTDTLSATSGAPIAENIVMLRAMYGKDSDGDGAIDTYDQTLPVDSVAWAGVLGVRFSVVARSHKREDEVVSPASLTLWPSMTMQNGTVIDAPTMALTDEQRHYRYKVFHTLVPLRNQLWRPPQ